MSITGVNVQTDGANYVLFEVTDLSDSMKTAIRGNLTGIWHGLSDTLELPSVRTYAGTLAAFLDTYNSKTEKTQKGMVGELLAHVLLNETMEKFKSASVLKNMEERHIKKGFDIIYYDPTSASLWYSEVKSGASDSGTATSTEYNKTLVERAKKGIIEMLDSGRSKLWDKALIEASLVLDSKTRATVQQLLASDLLTHSPTSHKNTILISVLYHHLSDKIDPDSLIQKHAAIVTEGCFSQHIIVSIQQHTYSEIADFLTVEASNT